MAVLLPKNRSTTNSCTKVHELVDFLQQKKRTTEVVTFLHVSNLTFGRCEVLSFLTKYRGHHDVLFAAAREAGLELMRRFFRSRSWTEPVFMEEGHSDKHRRLLNHAALKFKHGLRAFLNISACLYGHFAVSSHKTLRLGRVWRV